MVNCGNVSAANRSNNSTRFWRNSSTPMEWSVKSEIHAAPFSPCKNVSHFLGPVWEQDFQKDVGVHQIVHRSSLRWCCNSTAVNRRFKSAKLPAQSNLKRRFVERAAFVGVVFDKNSMNISTCFCATTGKVSYLAIKVSLLMRLQVTSEEPLAQSGNRHVSILRRVQSAMPARKVAKYRRLSTQRRQGAKMRRISGSGCLRNQSRKAAWFS